MKAPRRYRGDTECRCVISLLKTIRTLWFYVDGIRDIYIDNSRILFTVFKEFCEKYLTFSNQRYNNNNNNNNNNILLSNINILRHVL